MKDCNTQRRHFCVQTWTKKQQVLVGPRTTQVINDSCFDEVPDKTERVGRDAFVMAANNDVSVKKMG
jgi:hypothetical protein